MVPALVLVLAVLWPGLVLGQQVPGQFPAGTIYGNPGTTQALPQPALPSTFGIAVGSLPTSIDLGTVGPVSSGNTYTSAVQTGNANTTLTWSVLATQQVTISLQRYLDSAGTIPQGAAINTVAPASTQTTINTFDGLPFLSFKVSINNTSGSSATITNYALVVSLQTGRALWHSAIYTATATYTYTPVTSEVFISGCGGGGPGAGGQASASTAGGGGGSAGVSMYRRSMPVTVGSPLTITIPAVRTGGAIGGVGLGGLAVTVTGGLIPFQTLSGGNAGAAGAAAVGGNGGLGVLGGGTAGTPAAVGGNSVTRGPFTEVPAGGGGGANTAGNGTGSGNSSFAGGTSGGGANGGGGGAPSGFGVGGVAGANGVAGSAPASGYCGGGGGGGANAAGGDGGAALLIIEEMY